MISKRFQVVSVTLALVLTPGLTSLPGVAQTVYVDGIDAAFPRFSLSMR